MTNDHQPPYPDGKPLPCLKPLPAEAASRLRVYVSTGSPVPLPLP
ncbi:MULTISPECIES: hypothetical protein [Fischerella]|nr:MULTISPECIES: hypothetical protein [Fischerella]